MPPYHSYIVIQSSPLILVLVVFAHLSSLNLSIEGFLSIIIDQGTILVCLHLKVAQEQHPIPSKKAERSSGIAKVM